MRSDSLDSYIDYQELVDEIHSKALSAGLAFGKPQLVTHTFPNYNPKVAGENLTLDVLVTADEQPLPFYHRGLVWLQMLAGSPTYRTFQVSTVTRPTAQDWYPITVLTELVDADFRLLVPDYIATHGGSGPGPGPTPPPSIPQVIVDFGDGVATEFTILHNLDSKDLTVDVFDNSNGETLYVGIKRDTLNTVKLSLTDPPPYAGCRVIIRGSILLTDYPGSALNSNGELYGGPL